MFQVRTNAYSDVRPVAATGTPDSLRTSELRWLWISQLVQRQENAQESYAKQNPLATAQKFLRH